MRKNINVQYAVIFIMAMYLGCYKKIHISRENEKGSNTPSKPYFQFFSVCKIS